MQTDTQSTLNSKTDRLHLGLDNVDDTNHTKKITTYNAAEILWVAFCKHFRKRHLSHSSPQGGQDQSCPALLLCHSRWAQSPPYFINTAPRENSVFTSRFTFSLSIFAKSRCDCKTPGRNCPQLSSLWIRSGAKISSGELCLAWSSLSWLWSQFTEGGKDNRQRWHSSSSCSEVELKIHRRLPWSAKMRWDKRLKQEASLWCATWSLGRQRFEVAGLGEVQGADHHGGGS